MEIAKALHFMRSKQFDKAIETLKSYEKKDQTLVAHAATNLSFIYFHEADYPNAIKYADLAMKHNRYNAKALVNKGNCMFMRGDLEHARAMYQQAMGEEADCLEAIYNLGVVNKRLGELPSALGLFEKLHHRVAFVCPVHPSSTFIFAEQNLRVIILIDRYDSLVSG